MTETSVGYIRSESPLEKIVSSRLFWAFFMLLFFSYPIYRSMNRTLPEPLPTLYPAPAFKLTNEFNKPFASSDLLGKPYIASFMFTSCPTTCPALMEKMQLVQKRVRGLGTNFAILSFTVDPENDSPKVLHRYARDLQANPFVWTFLTGEKTDLQRILIDGYKVPMGEFEEIEGVVDGAKVSLFDIAHTNKVVLVDAAGMIRGYYSTTKEDIDRLMIDVGLLINNGYAPQDNS